MPHCEKHQWHSDFLNCPDCADPTQMEYEGRLITYLTFTHSDKVRLVIEISGYGHNVMNQIGKDAEFTLTKKQPKKP